MSEKPDSIWYYFHRPVKGSIRCKHCTAILQQDSYKSTGNLIRHLDKKHSEQESHRKKAIEETKKKRENAIASIPKITSFASSDPSSTNKDGTDLHTPEKRARIHSGGSQTIHDCFTQWKTDGTKTKKLDRIIAEMIAVDILPLRTTEKIGFQRLLKYLAPNYELKARTFFTEEIGRTYEELFERVKKDLAAQNSISVMYKMWLVDELVQNVEVRQNPNIEPEIEADVACTSERSTPISILEEFIQENSFGEIETLYMDTNETDRIKQEVNAYLIEPRSNVDIFHYWKINSEKWPRLTNLFRRFNSAPVGSQESERLFSIAGITLTDLRNRLTAENLEKLLFLHHNLPIYDFTY